MSHKTRERILVAALQLFNEKGLSQTPSRKITLHLDISQGHLTYYFPKRKDILDELYGQYRDQMYNILDIPTTNADSYTFFKWMHSQVDMAYTFRFLFLDFSQVMRESPEFKKDYIKLRALRKKKFLAFLRQLSQKNDFSLVYQQVELILEFGMVADILEQKKSKEKTLSDIKKRLELIFR